MTYCTCVDDVGGGGGVGYTFDSVGQRVLYILKDVWFMQ
jgi:hypothetical protein